MPKAQVIISSCSRRCLEVEQVRHFLVGNGYTLAESDWKPDPTADVVLLSSCGFTQPAEEYGFRQLDEVRAVCKPDALIVFGGCIPEINPERVAATFGGPTFSPQRYDDLDEILDARRPFASFRRPNTLEESGRKLLNHDLQRALDLAKTFDGSLGGLRYITRRLGNGLQRRVIRTRYAHLSREDTFYIQIQEGCSMRCGYCAIRTAIGPLRSRTPEAVMSDFAAGLEQGYRHFQLMGDNAGSFGLDIGTNLGRLLEQMLACKGKFDLDLTDINPVHLPMIFTQVLHLSRHGRLNSLFVPIQTGSRRILKLMQRDCDMDQVKEMLATLKQSAPPSFRMGTSLVVGYPSETEAEVEQSVRFCEEVHFDWVWCHSFSARPDTPAATLPGALPAEVIHTRAQSVKARLRGKALVTTAETTAGSKTCQG